VNNYGSKKKNITPFNPQSNGIIERVQLTFNDALMTAEVDGRELDKRDPRGPFSPSAAYTIHSTFHTTLKAMPGQLVFGRDMLLPINFVVGWGAIEQKRQKEMARNNKRENASILNHDYKVGDKALLKKSGKHLRKLEAPRTGPYTVTVIYTNGNLCIQKGNVNERVNITRLFPYFEHTDN
jgi:hypothetical protein